MTDGEVWVERYRPDTLEQIVGHPAVVETMMSYVDDSEMPNLLFAGPQGVGKTAIVWAFAREKYGEEWSNMTMELNASDERGIDVVRDRIKNFARTGSGEYDFQLVFLDEADQLTKDAQPALRRTMEDYSDTTRFILSCNYPNQIIDPIQSRCGPLRVTSLSDGQVVEVLERVVDGEDLDAADEALDRIARAARGDARQAINILNVVELDDDVTVERAQALLGVIDERLIEDIVDLAITGEFDDAMTKLDQEVLKKGANLNQLMEAFIRVVRRRDEFNGDSLPKAMDAIGLCDQRLREGANPHVQAHALLANLLLARHATTGGYTDG